MIILTNIASAASRKNPPWMAAIIMISLLKNPLKGGRPEIDMDAMNEVAEVAGIDADIPPISFRSRV